MGGRGREGGADAEAGVDTHDHEAESASGDSAGAAIADAACLPRERRRAMLSMMYCKTTQNQLCNL